MNDDVFINLNGLDSDMKKVIDRFPLKSEEFLSKSAREWKKDCNDKGYGKYDNKEISRSWTIRSEYSKSGRLEVTVKNKHRLFHLVENGHRMFIRGKDTGGFVQGRHYAEKTREEWKDKFPEKTEKFVSELLGGNNL